LKPFELTATNFNPVAVSKRCRSKVEASIVEIPFPLKCEIPFTDVMRCKLWKVEALKI
jgi:hypothetical protein